MNNLGEISDKIKILKNAREILHEEYTLTDFHKKKEANPHSTVPHSPEDEGIYKLLTAIQQLDHFVKLFQDKQFELIKRQDE